MRLHRCSVRAIFRPLWILVLLGLPWTAAPRATRAQPVADDPLPSWRAGAAKSAILAFVERVTRVGGPEFVSPAERIAVFDNDGTLWPENPMPFQLAFVIDEIRRLAPEHPEWADQPNIQAALRNDSGAILERGTAALAELLEVTHAGMPLEEFETRVRNWLHDSRHPRYGRPYTDLAYRPMVELLDLLRARGFRCYIVSGGGLDFMRVWAEATYGVPPEQVVGSYGRLEYQMREGVPCLIKRPEIEHFDDGPGKPVAIQRFLGRRPLAAFGNSDGDRAMLEWTTVGRRTSFGLIVHHTDAEREYAYDTAPRSTGKLVKALAEAPARGWVVVDMARDWTTLFRPEP